MNAATAKKAVHTEREVVNFGKPAAKKAPAKSKAKQTPPGSASVELPYVKSTQGTHVYGTEEREGVICRQVYLLKSELPEEPPASITLTVVW